MLLLLLITRRRKKKRKKTCSERPFLNGHDHPWETHVIPKRMASPT